MSLAETGYAPPIFAYVDKAGRPLWALVAILVFGLLAYINLSARGPLVFSWLLALGGLSTLFTWGTICLAHIRFRAAWRAQGHSLEELPFRAMCGVWGSWAALILVLLVLIAQFYVALDPVGGDASRSPGQVASAFFQSYLALPVVLLFYVVGYAWKRTTPQRAHQIDLDVSRSSSLPAILCFVSDDHSFFGRV
jgi:amino acid transporter